MKTVTWLTGELPHLKERLFQFGRWWKVVKIDGRKVFLSTESPK